MKPVYLPACLRGKWVPDPKREYGFSFKPDWRMRLTQRLRFGRFGVCPCCLKITNDIERKRQATMYTDDTSNWFTGCSDCHEQNDQYWQERWDELKSGWL